MRIGFVGLGVGTLAAYGRAGDVFRFYEIDPDVIRIAHNTAYFRYLADAEARVEIVPGDARLSLERELAGVGAPRFGLLVLDAFTSDAIPVHLLTSEAFRVYERVLRPGGLLAVHVSNANLELAPLVFGLGRELGMAGLAIQNRQAPRALQARATWVVLTQDRAALASIEQRVEARRHSLTVGMESSGPSPERSDQIRLRLSSFSSINLSLRSKLCTSASRSVISLVKMSNCSAFSSRSLFHELIASAMRIPTVTTSNSPIAYDQFILNFRQNIVIHSRLVLALVRSDDEAGSNCISGREGPLWVVSGPFD